MPLRIFITGATGYLGSAITARLARAGFEVHGLTRRAEGARALAALGARPVVGTLADPDEFIADLKNCDVAIHAATDPKATAPHDQNALEAIRAAAQDGRVRRLLYTSGPWDYGATGERVADESWPLNPIPRVRWRAAHHDVAFDLSEFEVRVSVMIPAIVYGGTRGMLGRVWGDGR